MCLHWKEVIERIQTVSRKKTSFAKLSACLQHDRFSEGPASFQCICCILKYPNDRTTLISSALPPMFHRIK